MEGGDCELGPQEHSDKGLEVHVHTIVLTKQKVLLSRAIFHNSCQFLSVPISFQILQHAVLCYRQYKCYSYFKGFAVAPRHREILLPSNRNSAAARNEICFFLLFGNFLGKLMKILFSTQQMLSDQKLWNHELF